MKDLDEAIEHAEKVAEEKDKEAYNWEYNYDMELPDTIAECKKCAAEHRQLAEWLKELKAARRVLEGYGIYYHDGRHYYEEGI